MKLVLPSGKYRDSYIDFVENAKIQGDYLEIGNALIRDDECFEDMIKRLKNRRKGKSISKMDVPASVYWIIVNKEVVGTIDLRHYLNDSYYKRLGHIAYYIKPSQRNNGYATLALRKALTKYKRENHVLITCFNDNIASSKVIIKNGGVLEKNIYDEITGKEISRYIVNIND